MTDGERRHAGAGASLFTRFLQLGALCALAVAACFFALVPMSWPQQALFAALCLLFAFLTARSSESYLVTLAIVLLSSFSTFRYGYWRIAQVVHFLRNPVHPGRAVDAFFMGALLLAELYAFTVLFLGYFQTIWPLRRAPAPLPDDPEEWPHVDVLIPTWNEPLDVVRFTVLAALNMDWPLEKLHVHLLDDGQRPEFAQFARSAGVGYRTRPENIHAKAGNLNAALKSTDSPFVAVFDADHVPTRSFLQMTIGWFLRDSRLGVLQTPHHFYSPDPFERNLRQAAIPNEAQFFYGIVQDGNDFWNASYFCGSCAILRRAALNGVGGIAEETVTEDAHTSLRLQKAGWSTAYINIPQAAGLAPLRLSDHVRQRIRWARGMVQILRLENPLFARGLTLPQRLCYFNAVAHFLYALPRLIFLTAPLAYLLLGHNTIPGGWAAILAFAVPHLALAQLANARIYGEHRYSFWNDIYETVLSPYILLPTLLALIRPRRGRFNVTPKVGTIHRTFFDTRIAQPFLLLLLLNLAGLALAVPRFLHWNSGQHGAVVINALWCLFNLVILGVCTAVAREMRQMRAAPRVPVIRPVIARLAGDISRGGETLDLSSGGASIRFDEPVEAAPQTQVRVAFPMPAVDMDLPATVVSCEGDVLRVRFEQLTIPEQEVLTMALYSRADTWLSWGDTRPQGRVLSSLARIFRISMHGLAVSLWTLLSGEKEQRGTTLLSIARTIVVVFASALLLGGSARLLAQQFGLAAAGRNLRVTLQDARHSSGIAALTDMLREKPPRLQLQPFRIGSSIYKLPSWTGLSFWLGQMPWLVALLVFGLILLLAVFMLRWLRSHARARLLKKTAQTHRLPQQEPEPSGA